MEQATPINLISLRAPTRLALKVFGGSQRLLVFDLARPPVAIVLGVVQTSQEMNSIISISIAALLSSAALSLSGEKDGHQTAEQLTIADPMLEGYAVIAEALFKGDLGGAKKAASRMVENDRKNVMSISARALSRSRDLSEARIHFRMLDRLPKVLSVMASVCGRPNA